MTVMGASAQAASYALTVAESDDSHGSIAFTVGGQSVGTAAAGATVTVTVTPETGWVLKTLTAETYMTGGEMRTRTRGIGDNPPTVSILGDVTLTPVEGNPNQFTMTMPSANVRFSADYLIATEITLEKSALQLKVNDEITTGASLTPAEAGSLVYTSSDEKVVKVENGVIKALAAGTATITVSFAGNDKYTAAESKTIEVTVSLKESSVSVNYPDGDLMIDDTFTFVATTTPEGLDATFILDDSGVLSLDDNGVVTALKEGTASVTVKVGGDGVYAESSTTVTLTVTKVPTEITVEKATLELKVGDEISTGASLTPAEAGSQVYTSSNEKVAVVKDGKIKALAAGTATITVSFAGTDKYAAAQSKTIAVTVTLNESSVSVNNLPPDGSCLYVDDTFTLITTTTPEGLNVTYIPDNSGVVSVDEKGVVTALKEGTASITVKIGGDGVYAESSTTVTLTVTKVPTEITVEESTLQLKVNDEIATGATLSPAEAGSLTYTSSNKEVAIVEEGKIKGLAAGTATITVSFAGDDKYAAAESQTITVTVTLKGDANNDGVVNVSDVVKAVSDGKSPDEIDDIVNIIMGE